MLITLRTTGNGQYSALPRQDGSGGPTQNVTPPSSPAPDQFYNGGTLAHNDTALETSNNPSSSPAGNPIPPYALRIIRDGICTCNC